MYRRASTVLTALVAASLVCGAFVVQAEQPASATGSTNKNGSVSAPVTIAVNVSHHNQINHKLIKRLRIKIHNRRHSTWFWERLSLMSKTSAHRHVDRITDVSVLRRNARHWHRLQWLAWQHAIHIPDKSDWLCIHGYEGAWNNPGINWLGQYSGYYGGLQMDMTFQQTYGLWLLLKYGTANHWTPLEQMWVAERARRNGRGFYPWPETAHECGLI